MVSRLLKVQPALVWSTLATVYAAGAMCYRAFVLHAGAWDMDVLVAAVTALYGLWTHLQVTPVARPRDADGRELVPRRPPQTYNPQPGDDLSR